MQPAQLTAAALALCATWALVVPGRSFAAEDNETVVFNPMEYAPLFQAFLDARSRPGLMGVKDHRTRVIVVRGDSLDDWQEVLELIRRDEVVSDFADALAFYESFKKSAFEDCQTWSVHSSSETSVTFEIDEEKCSGGATEHSLGRVLFGRHRIFLVKATVKGSMDETAFAGWMSLLATAEVESYEP